MYTHMWYSSWVNYVSECKRKTCRTWFFSAAVWLPGVELRISNSHLYMLNTLIFPLW